ASQRHMEERERVAHLNRAKDIQILREQPFDILNQESKLEKLAPGKDPARLGGHGTIGTKERTKDGRGHFPQTAVDYNILSNMPFQQHHWAKHDERPRLKEKSPRVRKVPAFLCKDFDIINNRYLDNHSEKLRQEKHVNLLEATDKHMTRNAYDPLAGKFIDPYKEERLKSIDDTREVEIAMRGNAMVPPSYKAQSLLTGGNLLYECRLDSESTAAELRQLLRERRTPPSLEDPEFTSFLVGQEELTDATSLGQLTEGRLGTSLEITAVHDGGSRVRRKLKERVRLFDQWSLNRARAESDRASSAWSDTVIDELDELRLRDLVALMRRMDDRTTRVLSLSDGAFSVPNAFVFDWERNLVLVYCPGLSLPVASEACDTQRTQHVNPVSQTYDSDMLHLFDTLQKERTDRYKWPAEFGDRNRHIIDHNFHARDIKGDHIREVRQLNRVAPERYEEQRRRGYDIIDGKGYGPSAKEKHLHDAYPKKRPLPDSS
ncbi:unnamed protein product, partial [Symbiodinium sp. CCMP2456]